MTQQTRRWNPGDAANVFVRVILSDAGTMLGGLTESEWRKTLEWFDGRCAYTGEERCSGNGTPGSSRSAGTGAKRCGAGMRATCRRHQA